MNRIVNAEFLLLSSKYTEAEIWRWPGGEYRGWTTAFVRLTADSGETGLGEIGDGLNTPLLIPPLYDRAARLVTGLSVSPRVVRDTLARSAPGWGAAGLFQSVIAGFELAAFDLLGRIAGLPAHQLLGGAKATSVTPYASGGLSTDPDAIHREVARYVDQGFNAVKIRIGFGSALDADRAAAARDALGPDRRLMLDLGASYLPEPPDARQVMALFERLAPASPYWLEDPLPRRDVAGHARLRRELPTRIATGENERDADLVQRWLEADAIDILQTDALYVGGILNQLELADLSYQYGVALAPHTWGSGPGLMANLTAVATARSGLWLEYPQPLNPFREGTLATPLQLVDGRITVPEAAGLNVILPESFEGMIFDENAGPVLRNAARAAEEESDS